MGEDRTGAFPCLGPVPGAGRYGDMTPHLLPVRSHTGVLVSSGLGFLFDKTRVKITALPSSGDG